MFMRIKLLLACLFLVSIAFAQEVVTSLKSNPVLIEKGYSLSQNRMAGDTLELPFKDDFSVLEIYPDTARWLDNLVFITADMPVEPISIGAAVFDGLDELGQAYNFANPTNSAFADELTSKPINLDYPAGDSVYLSFYYQEKGRGNAPENTDSLVLEFKSVSFSSWTQVWSVGGGNGLRPFKQVMIPIKDTNFLENGFQFRFRNYGSLAGQVDIWSLDYVVLDRERSKSDTIPLDVCYIERPEPYFKTGLRSMPWRHFKNNQQSLRKDTFFFNIKNRSDSLFNVDYRIEIRDMNGYSFIDATATDNAQPLSDFNKKKVLNYSIPQAGGERNDLEIKYYLKAGQAVNDSNDFIKERIVLNDFYAYDDGTAEAAYGLQGANGRLALGFDVPGGVIDSLAGALIHFEQIVENASSRVFSIGLYEGDTSTGPTNLIYEMDSLYKANAVQFFNGFAYFPFDSTLRLDGGRRYYLSMYTPGALPLNIGLDYNTDASPNLFYSFSGGNWNQSLVPAAVMIRPVMGDYKTVLSTQEPKELPTVVIYPNPANSNIHIDSEEEVMVQLFNLQGQEVLRDQGNLIAINHLPKGLYIVQVTSLVGEDLGRQKLIIQ